MNTPKFVSFAFLVLSVVAAPILVNATDRKGSVARKQTNSMTIKEFVNAFFQGAPVEGKFSKAMGAFAGFPDGADSKIDGVSPEETGDGQARQCNLILEPSEDGKPSPVCLIMITNRSTDDKRISRYFRIGIDGKLEKAFTWGGKPDGNARMMKGTGVHTPLDVDSKEVLALMKKELEFWMKKYSKPGKKQTAAVSGGAGSKISAAQ